MRTLPRWGEGWRRFWPPSDEILEAYVFGSVARGQAQTHSDVDVAAFVDPKAGLSGGFGLRAQLTTELMAGMGTNDVDVVILNQAPPLLYHRVLRDGIRIFARNLKATTVRKGRVKLSDRHHYLERKTS